MIGFFSIAYTEKPRRSVGVFVADQEPTRIPAFEMEGADVAELPGRVTDLDVDVRFDRGLCQRWARVGYLDRGSHPMCDYSLHAVASRPAKAGETLITTTFPGTSSRGFAAKTDPAMAVCLLPGTELAFADDVRYDRRWIWTRKLVWRVGQFNRIEPNMPDRHHDAIEFPDGKRVLLTQLSEGQRVTVLQLPVPQPPAARAPDAMATDEPERSFFFRWTDPTTNRFAGI